MRTTTPAYAFRPEGSLPRFRSNTTHQLRHASLPSEHVCTENLTPFLKQLPCKASAGIASLLNPHRLFDADWHGMGVHVTWDREKGVHLQLSFQAVFDPVRLSASRQRGELRQHGKSLSFRIRANMSFVGVDFSFSSLFDRTISRACPVASKSEIEVYMPQDIAYSITPEPTALPGQVGLYDISSGRIKPQTHAFLR